MEKTQRLEKTPQRAQKTPQRFEKTPQRSQKTPLSLSKIPQSSNHPFRSNLKMAKKVISEDRNKLKSKN
jgi:hypothetical protein